MSYAILYHAYITLRHDNVYREGPYFRFGVPPYTELSTLLARYRPDIWRATAFLLHDSVFALYPCSAISSLKHSPLPPYCARTISRQMPVP